MFEVDEEHTSFITNQGLYCYKVILFSHKNSGSTYEKLGSMMFKDLICQTMEVYIDDMLMKLRKARDYVTYLGEMLAILKRCMMKLNLLKCTFGVGSGKFLGFVLNQTGIEDNLEKIKHSSI